MVCTAITIEIILNLLAFYVSHRNSENHVFVFSCTFWKKCRFTVAESCFFAFVSDKIEAFNEDLEHLMKMFQH